MKFARGSARLVTSAAAGLLALAACGGGETTDLADGSSSTTTAPAATLATATPSQGTDAAAVPAVLDFDAPLVGGGEIEMGQYAGRPVLLWFWAPW